MKKKYLRATDAADKINEAQRKYFQTEKGKQARSRYQRSELGRTANREWAKTDAGKFVQTKAQRKYYLKKKAEREIAKAFQVWSVDNPGKTIEDFMRENGYNGTTTENGAGSDVHSESSSE
jgi:hypothetical protein